MEPRGTSNEAVLFKREYAKNKSSLFLLILSCKSSSGTLTVEAENTVGSYTSVTMTQRNAQCSFLNHSSRKREKYRLCPPIAPTIIMSKARASFVFLQKQALKRAVLT